jgi:hypothetical protein
VPRERKRQLVASNAAAIVRYSNERGPAGFELHGNALRARVKTVLDELFQCRCRTIDHFARSDLIDE